MVKNEYLSTSYKGIEIDVTYDTDCGDPFKEWDGLYPTMTIYSGYKTDYSDGDIYNYVTNFLTDNQIIRHQNKIMFVMSNYFDKSDLDSELTRDEKVDQIRDFIDEYIRDEMGNLVTFCQVFKIKHHYETSYGTCQGEWANVFICWTPEYEKITGESYKKVTKESLKETFDLFTNWAWGNVFNVSCDYIGESCGGFYGEKEAEDQVEEVKKMIDESLNSDVKSYILRMKEMIKNRVPLYYRNEISAEYYADENFRQNINSLKKK